MVCLPFQYGTCISKYWYWRILLCRGLERYVICIDYNWKYTEPGYSFLKGVEYRRDTFFMIAEIWGFLHLLSSTAAVVEASCFESVPSMDFTRTEGETPATCWAAEGRNVNKSHTLDRLYSWDCVLCQVRTHGMHWMDADPERSVHSQTMSYW